MHGFENAAGRAQDEWSASKAGLKELSEHLRLLLHLPNPVDRSIQSLSGQADFIAFYIYLTQGQPHDTAVLDQADFIAHILCIKSQISYTSFRH